MKNIIDTHAVIWLAANASQLSLTAKHAIFNPASKNYVSIVSAWEICIKISLGKLRIEGGVAEFFNIIYENGFELLPLKEDYIKLLEALPLLHRDPFDRMLIASAIYEGMNLITADDNIRLYNVSCLW